jgi:beta-N-acetylhexosaminidase
VDSALLSVGTGAAIFGCAGPDLTADEAAFFQQADPFGFILFARNIQNPPQVIRLCNDLRAAVGRDAPILIDQEGGRVQRLRAPQWREWAPPFDMVQAAPETAARAMVLRTQIISAELRALGIDTNCAPVADIAGPQTHPFLANRCYGTTAAQVGALARLVAQTHLDCGVLPIIKHIPGHGRATADTHLNLPRVSARLDDLIASDFAPFAALADLPMAMTAHIIFDALDPARAATLSPSAITYIRQSIGFSGLLITDDLNMQALAGDIGARAGAAIAAGCDIALHCNGDLAQMQAVALQAGAMPPATLARARRAIARRITAPALDITALTAEFLSLTQGRGQVQS